MEQIGLEAVLQDSNFQAGLKRYLDGVKSMSSETSKSADSMSKQFVGLGDKVWSVSGQIAKAAAIGFGAITAAAAAAGLASLKAAGDYQEAMSRIQGLTDTTATQVGIFVESQFHSAKSAGCSVVVQKFESACIAIGTLTDSHCANASSAGRSELFHTAVSVSRMPSQFPFQAAPSSAAAPMSASIGAPTAAIAVPIAAIAEAIAAPPSTAPMPASAPAMEGRLACRKLKTPAIVACVSGVMPSAVISPPAPPV